MALWTYLIHYRLKAYDFLIFFNHNLPQKIFIPSRTYNTVVNRQSWNILLFFEIDANREDFFGRDIDVSGSLRDAMGREVLLEATMTIADGSN